MKKHLLFISAALAAVLLVGCGSAGVSSAAPSAGSSAGAVHGSSADYAAVIEAARPAELNELEMYAVVTSPDDALHDGFFSGTFGLVEDDYDKYALSISAIITKAYGVMIILPKEGQEEAVLAQVNAFVQQQQNAMQNYLQDQYEIAKNAIVKTAPTGEVLLALCEDAPTVMAAMEEGLS